jgi:hypothetical protein
VIVMRNAVLALVLVCLLVLQAGCLKGGIVGKWHPDGPGGEATTVEFTADNHLMIKGPSQGDYTWYKIEGDKMTTGHLQPGMPDETRSFKLSGDTLVIKGPMGDQTLRRAK